MLRVSIAIFANLARCKIKSNCYLQNKKHFYKRGCYSNSNLDNAWYKNWTKFYLHLRFGHYASMPGDVKIRVSFIQHLFFFTLSNIIF